VNLTATTHALELVTSSGATTHWTTSWSDIDKSGAATVLTPGSSAGTVASATDTTIVAAPSASVYRVVTFASIANRHGSLAVTVQVQKDVSGTEYVMKSATLEAGQELIYTDKTGWRVYNADGTEQVSGRDGVDGATGAAGVGVTGTDTIDFGVFPGSSHTTRTIADAGVLSGSVVEAWLRPVASADHSADEHRIEPIEVSAGDIAAGVSFVVHARYAGQLYEPNVPIGGRAPGGVGRNRPTRTSWAPRAYGVWNITWRRS
jgi:hypothetical protein